MKYGCLTMPIKVCLDQKGGFKHDRQACSPSAVALLHGEYIAFTEFGNGLDPVGRFVESA
jgi:hypothetical protein